MVNKPLVLNVDRILIISSIRYRIIVKKILWVYLQNICGFLAIQNRIFR